MATVALDYAHIADRGIACVEPLLSVRRTLPDHCLLPACAEREIWRVDRSQSQAPIRLEAHCASPGEISPPTLERVGPNVVREIIDSDGATFTREMSIVPAALLRAESVQAGTRARWDFARAEGTRCGGSPGDGATPDTCEPALGRVLVRSTEFATHGWETTDLAGCGFRVPTDRAPPGIEAAVSVLLTTDDRLYVQIDDGELALGRTLGALTIEGDFIEAKPTAAPLRLTIWSDGTVCEASECRTGGAAVAGAGRVRRAALLTSMTPFANLWFSYDRGSPAKPKPTRAPPSDRRTPVLVGPPTQVCVANDGTLRPEPEASVPPPDP